VCSEFKEKGQDCFSTDDCWEFMKEVMISLQNRYVEELKDLRDTRKLCDGMKRFQLL